MSTKVEGITAPEVIGPAAIRSREVNEVDALPMTDGTGRIALFIEGPSQETSIQLRGSFDDLKQMLRMCLAEVVKAEVVRKDPLLP